MQVLSKALAYAMAYLGSVLREADDDADNDVKALEDIAALLNGLTEEEKSSLRSAAQQAITSEQKSNQPNHSLIEGYQSVLEHLAEQEG